MCSAAGRINMAKQIPLSKGKFALVDDDMYDYLMQWKWTFSGGYTYRIKTIKGVSKKIWMHREVNATANGLYTDHIDGNRLNNTRANLRTKILHGDFARLNLVVG